MEEAGPERRTTSTSPSHPPGRSARWAQHMLAPSVEVEAVTEDETAAGNPFEMMLGSEVEMVAGIEGT